MNKIACPRCGAVQEVTVVVPGTALSCRQCNAPITLSSAQQPATDLQWLWGNQETKTAATGDVGWLPASQEPKTLPVADVSWLPGNPEPANAFADDAAPNFAQTEDLNQEAEAAPTGNPNQRAADEQPKTSPGLLTVRKKLWDPKFLALGILPITIAAIFFFLYRSRRAETAPKEEPGKVNRAPNIASGPSGKPGAVVSQTSAAAVDAWLSDQKLGLDGASHWYKGVKNSTFTRFGRVTSWEILNTVTVNANPARTEGARACVFFKVDASDLVGETASKNWKVWLYEADSTWRIASLYQE